MRLLLSLCNTNQYNSQFSLAVIDTESGERWLVDCGAFLDFKADNGVTGLLQTPGGLAVATQSGHPRVSLLDPSFRVVWAATDERLTDVHSLTLHPDGRILAMSSGRNKILEIDPKTGKVGLFWEYAPVATPFLHINSLAFLDGKPVVCSHKLPPEAKHPSETGGAWRLDNWEVLIPGLRAPHTLTAHDGGLISLSSGNGRVVGWKDGKISETEIPGYVRGMLIGKEEIFIGSSALRFISRKTQGVKRYADFKNVVGNPAYMSDLVVCDRTFREIRRIGTTFLGFELYDIVADPGVPQDWLVAEAPAVRMQTMQRLTVTLREQLQAARHRAQLGDEDD